MTSIAKATDQGTVKSSPGWTPSPNALILVGLGNSGKKFTHTRHNAGRMALDYLAISGNITWRGDGGWDLAQVEIDGVDVVLAKPDGSINNSGEVMANWFSLDSLLSNVIVVYDDADLSCGDVKFKASGGDGGHLGIRSIIETFGTPEFRRLKLGVRPYEDKRSGRQLAHGRLSPEEQEKLSAAFAKRLGETITDWRIRRSRDAERKAPVVGPEIVDG